jgi:tetratricopeptide (TPR) repeat protein
MGSIRALLAAFFDRRVNLRVLALLVLSLTVLGGTLYGLHQIQVRRCAGYFLERAQQAKSDGDTEGAVRLLEQYLSLVPDDPDAMAELGLLLADRAPGWRAYKLLEASVRHRPGRTDVHRKLAELAIKLGRFSDACEHLKDHLLVISPDDDELLAMLARCQAARGQYEAAVETLGRAIQAAPGKVELYGQVAGLLRRRLDRPDDATRWMDQLVEENPDLARAHLLRGGSLRLLRWRWTKADSTRPGTVPSAAWSWTPSRSACTPRWPTSS